MKSPFQKRSVGTTSLKFSEHHDTFIQSISSLDHLAPFLHAKLESLPHLQHGFLISDDSLAATPDSLAPAAAVSPYSKVDKTGFIGGIATYVEYAIDGGHNLLKGLGLKYTYGYAIILFTVFGKKLFFLM